jgi:hypothetical protein
VGGGFDAGGREADGGEGVSLTKAGLGAAADEEEIEEQAEQAVEQGQEHDPGSAARSNQLPIGVPHPTGASQA